MKKSRAEVCAFLAGWYTCKMQGRVWCMYDAFKRAYCVRGVNLPTHPHLIKDAGYPRTWSMLDYVKPARARKLMEAGEQWYDMTKLYP